MNSCKTCLDVALVQIRNYLIEIVELMKEENKE